MAKAHRKFHYSIVLYYELRCTPVMLYSAISLIMIGCCAEYCQTQTVLKKINALGQFKRKFAKLSLVFFFSTGRSL